MLARWFSQQAVFSAENFSVLFIMFRCLGTGWIFVHKKGDLLVCVSVCFVCLLVQKTFALPLMTFFPVSNDLGRSQPLRARMEVLEVLSLAHIEQVCV